MEEMRPFMGTHWLLVEDDTVTVGVSEEGTADLDEISRITLPEDGESVSAEEVCGEIYTPDGPFNLYSPVDGKIVEINTAVVENPELILEDPTGDGWLFKVEANDPDDLEHIGESDDILDEDQM